MRRETNNIAAQLPAQRVRASVRVYRYLKVQKLKPTLSLSLSLTLTLTHPALNPRFLTDASLMLAVLFLFCFPSQLCKAKLKLNTLSLSLYKIRNLDLWAVFE